MTETVAGSGVVHWLGAGLSTGSGLAAVCADAKQVLLWQRDAERAGASLDRLGLRDAASPRGLDEGTFDAELGPGDVVVSMLPAVEHAGLVRRCVAAGAHFACTSYVSDEIRAAAAGAADAGVVVLTEAGLDPGIDHLYAHDLVDRAVAELGDTAVSGVRFSSYCGGIPAEPNEFRYRFSWAPLGVLTALRTPARYVTDGAPRTVARPWEATEELAVGGEPFEVYPNRDSVPFRDQYRLPPSWPVREFVRGTLRLPGWRTAWEPVFSALRSDDDARIAALATELADRYPLTEADRDRVVLTVGLQVSRADGGTWSGSHLLDLTGTPEETAMAACVSQTLAVGIGEVSRGNVTAGLHRAAESAEDARRWLSRLAERGIGGTAAVEPG